jgi:hypothetical protein
LNGEKDEEWYRYMCKLCSRHIMVVVEDIDSLAWSKNSLTREYSTKLGYNSLMEVDPNEPPKWW